MDLLTTAATKICIACDETKPADAFYRRKTSTGLSGRCQDCQRAKDRERYAKNPERFRRYKDQFLATHPNYFLERDLQRFYGMTLAEYDTRLIEQGGVCAVCESSDPGGRSTNERFHVDHNHETGKTRGLLCHKCNTGLGLLGDDIDSLTAALAYLMETE